MYRNGLLTLAFLFLTALTGCSHSGDNTPPPPPLSPENLILKPVGPHQVKLSWTIPVTQFDSFVIQRSENNGEFVSIATVNQDSLEFIDDGISLEATYTYQVIASNHSTLSDPITSAEYHHPVIDACNTSPLTAVDPKVVFYDIAVSGLTYTSNSSFYQTDSNGAFTWDQSNEVIFSIGYIEIGYLKAGDKPGLMSIARNYNTDTRITINNLLRLLTTLDEDNDITNGIQIPCEASLAYGEVDPTLDYDAFAQQETVYRLTGGKPLLSASDARNRYEEYLYQDYVGHYEANWEILIYGVIPLSATIPFDINSNGDITHIGESIIEASLDPHDNYRLRLVDIAALALGFGFYQIEIDANINQDKTITGKVLLKSIEIGDIKGKVSGGRIP